jgi:hypothetical protein
MNSGSAETGQSQGLLGQAGSYYSSLLSGNRAATMSAVAPTATAATGQADAAKRSLSASGTMRGGGANVTGQTINDQTRSTIDNAINTDKAGAAGGATATGSTMASQAGNLLGMGETAASNLTADAGGSRGTSASLRQNAISSASSLTSSALDALFG